MESTSTKNTCTRKNVSFVTGIVFMIILFVLFLTVAIDSNLLGEVYYFDQNNHTPIVVLFLVGTLLLELSCILLIVGLLKENIKMVLAWLIIMTMFWNVNLVISIISIINFIVIKKIQSVPFRSLSLLAAQSVWLVMIGIVYCYWRGLTEIRDLPSLLEYFERKRAEASEAEIARAPPPSIRTTSDSASGPGGQVARLTTT